MGFKGNEKIEGFLKSVCDEIRNKDVHLEVSSEIREHLYDIYSEYKERGVSEDEAISKALKRIGDPKDIGKGLNKIHKAKFDYITLFGVMTLVIAGLVSMYYLEAASLAITKLTNTNIMNMFICIAIGTVLYNLDYRVLQKYGYHIYFSTVIVLILASFNSTMINGRPELLTRLSLPSVVLFLISLSGLINRLNLNKLINNMIILAMAAIPFFIYLFTPHFSIALIYGVTFIAVFLMSSAKRIYKYLFLAFNGVGFGTVLIYVLSSSHRIERLIPILNPLNSDTSAYIHNQSIKLLKSAGILGKDIGVSGAYLPNMHTEFSFSALVYSLGWIVGILVLGIMMVFIARNIILVTKLKDSYGRNIVLSITMIIGIQFLLAVVSCFGILDILYGLPFISFGRVDMMTNSMMIGILLSVHKRKGLSETVVSRA